MTPLLIKHLSGESIGRFPVWLMRQAGRYQPSYRAIRAKHTFWEMVTQPELAVEVSLLPLNELNVDGVILFSDILTLPYGFGIPIEMQESVGPVATAPLRTEADFARFAEFTPSEHVAFVGKSLRTLRNEIPREKALLGFAGAPWTVGTYLTEGKHRKNFAEILKWSYRDPMELARSLESLGKATLSYLLYQRESGADVVQLFDTWLSEMPIHFFRNYYAPILQNIFLGLEEKKVPCIYFAKHAHHLTEEIAKLPVPILSIDNLRPLKEMDLLLGEKHSLQGNLDPIILLGDEGSVRRATRLLVQEARTLRRPAILNLGHGVLPQTPVENVKAFVEEAQTLWI